MHWMAAMTAPAPSKRLLGASNRGPGALRVVTSGSQAVMIVLRPNPTGLVGFMNTGVGPALTTDRRASL